MLLAGSTHAQRLQHDEHPRSHSLDEDPREQQEAVDQAFRHFDQFVFAPQAAFAAPGRDHGRDRAATTSSDSSGGGPATHPSHHPPNPRHNGSAGGETGRSPAPGLAPPWQHHAFTLDTPAQCAHRLSSVESVFADDAQTLSAWRDA